ncbi:spermidine/putrescine transport system substrate-binding protein [Clostridium cavendishii DSM 21758]|uniref:Spermidine/putrescine transport system substrate-binding protein n=1 Tax=Clostridium cavendishii DSM 21758 TaxID=1121302 RepID=A0A1M6UUI4_9CLOT|nr:spermidine/putrescine ABC transporter substrate-binding protein [Clostridium cavendishii]SHK72889.1 spermidine/putrescine transport system substrate-binding protein [Clostridium cavendishii DSM 21758]
MNKFFKVISIAVCFMIGISTFTSCSKKEQVTLNVFNWGDNMDMSLIKDFEAKYNIKVNYSTYDTNEDMYTKVKSDTSQYDIVVPSDYMVQKMIKEDMLSKLDFSNIPNFKKIDETFLGRVMDPKNEYSVPYMSGTIGIIYNKNLVKEPVDSFNILWNEKYKGQIFMLDAQRDTIGVALKKLGYSLNSTKDSELEEAKKELIKQKPLVLAYVQDDVKDKMIQGEGALATIWSGEGLHLQEQYPYLEYIVPKEGANFWVDSFAVPKNAKHKKEAEIFINFMCEKDSALKNAAEVGYTTPQVEAKKAQPESVQKNKNAYMTKEMLDKCENYQDIGENIKKYDKIWTEIKSQK